jgi:uncharacterized protein (DUF1501 family)
MPKRACHCNEFSRVSLLRRVAAEAGRGLPAIEPGMPLPAGTGLHRRAFLARSAGVALAVYGASKLGLNALDEGIANAATAPTQPVLVSVFLPGGADSLSVLYPAGDPNYRKLRPKLALAESAGPVFTEDNRLHWHPSLASLATLHGEGKVAVAPAIGYTHPDQSHFTSRHFWEVGATEANLRTGWMGRYLDAAGTADNPLQGLSLDDTLQPPLASTKVPVAALAGADDYSFWAPGVWGEVEDRMLDAIGSLGKQPSRPDPKLRKAAAVTSQADILRRQLVPFATLGQQPNFGSTIAYPTTDSDFPKRLAGLAAMLAAGLPLRCVALNAPGEYDTHANQADDLASGLKVTAESLLAFQRDLEARGLASRVVTLVWSEFGRRAAENGSSGTDHGAGGTAFLIGSRVRGQLIGEFPGLGSSGLDGDGNLVATADFRAVYSSLLEQWLGAEAERVIPGAGSFDRPALIS